MKLRLVTLFLGILFLNTMNAQTVTLKQIGKENILFNHTFPVYFNGNLYSLDIGRALYKTDLTTGEFTRLGTVVYKNTRLFFELGGRLYSVEMDGSMTQIDPVSGNWTVVTPIGGWTDLARAIPIGNTFYGIDNGSLYRYAMLNPKARKQIGESEFQDPGALIRTDTTLHSMISGTLYKINLTTGKWDKIGKNRNWRSAVSAAIIGDKIYTIESPTSFFESSLTDGTKKELDSKQFEKMRFVFPDSGKLYTISKEGTLYEIVIQNN